MSIIVKEVVGKKDLKKWVDFPNKLYKNAPAYVNGVSEEVFKVGMCLPAGPYVTDDDVRYIVETIKSAIIQ